MKYVSMVKISAVDAPRMPPGDPTTYHYGQQCETGHSLPEGYQLEGFLAAPPTVGKCVEILRCARNGISILGLYSSTPVTLVQGNIFHTHNSVYRLDEMSPPLPEKDTPTNL